MPQVGGYTSVIGHTKMKIYEAVKATAGQANKGREKPMLMENGELKAIRSCKDMRVWKQPLDKQTRVGRSLCHLFTPKTANVSMIVSTETEGLPGGFVYLQ